MEELELGLSLCAKTAINAGGEGDDERSLKWGKKNCRILTAKDFPMARLMATQISSSSSVSSSSISANDGGGGCGGDLEEKRGGDLVPQYVVGASNQISQGLVGWPPVRAFRMNNMTSQFKGNMMAESNASEQKNKTDYSSLKQKAMGYKEIKDNKSFDGSRFVKVNMDGDPIGRKVDLDAHESYKALALSLETMFYKPASSYGMKTLKLLDGSNEFALTYEDRDGDWMLVGDVPWSMFLETVRRLRIMKISEANGQKLKLSFSHESGVLPT